MKATIKLNHQHSAHLHAAEININSKSVWNRFIQVRWSIKSFSGHPESFVVSCLCNLRGISFFSARGREWRCVAASQDKLFRCNCYCSLQSKVLYLVQQSLNLNRSNRFSRFPFVFFSFLLLRTGTWLTPVCLFIVTNNCQLMRTINHFSSPRSDSLWRGNFFDKSFSLARTHKYDNNVCAQETCVHINA